MSTGIGWMAAVVVACAILTAQSPLALAQERAALSVRDLLGAWAGVTPGGTPIEFRVDAIRSGGRVAGARCEMRLSWIDTVTPLPGVGALAVRMSNGSLAIQMSLTEAHVRLGVVGNAASLRLDLVDAHTLDYTAIPSASAHAAGLPPARARLRRVQRLPCLDRYSAVPGRVAPPAVSVPILGFWTSSTSQGSYSAVPGRVAPPAVSVPILGFWTSSTSQGKVVEVALESISPRGIIAGRFCIKIRKTQDIQLIDLDPLAGPRYLARYDADDRSLVFERNTIESDGNRRRDRFVMTLSGDGGLGVAVAQRYASSRAKTMKITLRRGADPHGCLLQVLPKGWTWR